MTQHATVDVRCSTCDGSGNADDGRPCPTCYGLTRIAIDRTPDGGIPAGYIEWVPPLLSPERHARTQ